MTETKPVTGGCICGGVRYLVDDQSKLRPVIACHCEQCRRFSGHFIAASGTKHDYFQLVNDETLRWYSYVPGVQQGFCGECGCSLFFDYPAEKRISIAAGTLDDSGNLSLTAQIYCGEAGDYYQLHTEGEMIDKDDIALGCPD